MFMLSTHSLTPEMSFGIFCLFGFGGGEYFKIGFLYVALVAPSVDHASLEARDLLPLGLKMYTTTIGLEMVFLY